MSCVPLSDSQFVPWSTLMDDCAIVKHYFSKCFGSELWVKAIPHQYIFKCKVIEITLSWTVCRHLHWTLCTLKKVSGHKSIFSKRTRKVFIYADFKLISGIIWTYKNQPCSPRKLYEKLRSHSYPTRSTRHSRHFFSKTSYLHTYPYHALILLQSASTINSYLALLVRNSRTSGQIKMAICHAWSYHLEIL